MSSTLDVVYNTLVDNKLSVSLFNSVGLPRLAPYWPRILVSAACFQMIYLAVSMCTSIVFSGMWKRLTKVQKYKWCVRKVSILHAVFIVTQALVIIANMDLRRNPVHGTDPVAEKAFTVTVGYFLWDIVNTYQNLHVNGWGFMIHAVLSFGVYMLAYSPLLQYYGACFMMFEVSTIFLNIHLGLNDLGWTDYVMYFINGMAVVSSFFFARLVYGTMLTINVWRELKNSAIPISPLASAYIRFANMVLLGMSYYWFYLIIKETKNTVLDADLIRALDEMDKKEMKEKA